MTRFGWIVIGGVLAAALGIALLLWGFARQSNPGLDLSQGGVGDVDPATLSIYTNGTYGFSLFYPVSGVAEDSFTEETAFLWRAGATATGTPIVRITTLGGEVRIGASAERRAIDSCLAAGQAEEDKGTVKISEREWRAFSFETLGTDDERRVTSYRTLYEGSCFVMEAFERVDAPRALPTEEVGFIVNNFSFAR